MNIYTNKFQPQLFEKIKTFFETHNAEFSQLQYALWKAEGKGFVAALYKSGKFVIQGKEISVIVSDFEECIGVKSSHVPESSDESIILPVSEYIGTDESGKGDFFGPLVIAGVFVNTEISNMFLNLGIKDSKKLDDERIKKLAIQIRNNAPHSVVVVMPEKYNELYSSFKNLNKLLAWGHARVIENVLEKSPCTLALADKFGDESLIKNALLKNGRNITLIQKVRGEANIAVAAASVVARAEFVKRCSELCDKYSTEFPKGASEKVSLVGKKFLQKFGRESLKYVAKMHFKTLNNL